MHRTISRRGVAITLGILWLLDGLLQLQPAMFTSKFTEYVIDQAAQGQPWIIAAPMHFFISLFLLQPGLCNAVVAVIQLSLGVLILNGQTRRIGLITSMVWGVYVWVIGEGLSGLASGHSLMLMGLPGAAIIYVLLAGAVLPTRHNKADQRPAYWLIIVWAVIWTAGAIYQLMPGQNVMADVSSMITNNTNGAPAWLASVDNDAISLLGNFGNTNLPNAMANMPNMPGPPPTPPKNTSSGFIALLVLALVQLGIALAVFLPGRPRLAAVITGSVLSLIFWVIGQSVGSYYSGLATDPNTGPLLILLGIAVLACTQHDDDIVKRLHLSWLTSQA